MLSNNCQLEQINPIFYMHTYREQSPMTSKLKAMTFNFHEQTANPLFVSDRSGVRTM